MNKNIFSENPLIYDWFIVRMY